MCRFRLKYQILLGGLVAMLAMNANVAAIDFQGNVDFVEVDTGGGVYAGDGVGAFFTGSIDVQPDGTFTNGRISNGRISTGFSCCGIAAESDLSNNLVLDEDLASVLNTVLGASAFSAGDRVDIVDIEGDSNTANGTRIEVGLSYVFPADTFADGLRSFADVFPLFDPDQATAALFFILEDDDGDDLFSVGDDIYSVLGLLDNNGGMRNDAIALWRPNAKRFFLDSTGNGQLDGTGAGDIVTEPFGLATDLPVTGDWNGDGVDDVGVWRPSLRRFFLDANGNDQWDGPAGGDTVTSSLGLGTDLPIVGDWNGDGSDDVGLWRSSARRFFLDANGNGQWDGTTGGDIVTSSLGLQMDLPVAGDWNGDGIDDVGLWRSNLKRFFLDTNGNGQWDGTGAGDSVTGPFGLATDLPVTGDWNGDGADEIGVWRSSARRFLLDANGDDRWNGSAGGDTVTSPLGLGNDKPLAGKW